MIVMILLLLAGFGALYFGADWMVRGAARLQGSLGLSPIVIGLTVVSLGTSAPELFVAVLATLRGSSDLAVGNVLGSNLANIGLILGVTAMVQPLMVVERVVKRDIPIMILLTLLLYPFLLDGVIDRANGVALSCILALYLTYVFQRGKKTPTPLVSEYSRLAEEVKGRKGKALIVDVGLLVVGTAGLLMGGRAIVESATYLAGTWGMSQLNVGLTIVALGTSLPELATSVMAAARKHTDIAVGNVIGSNIFNITGVVGVTGAIKDIDVDPGVLWVEFPAVMILSLMAFAVPLFPLRKGKYRIRRWEGALLLATYVGLFTWILY